MCVHNCFLINFLILLLVQREHIENQLLYEKGVEIVVGGWLSKWKTSWWINIEYYKVNEILVNL
jgi:hypothetical protein